MLDELKSAARKVTGARQLRGLLIDCKRLLSERGEANSVAIAQRAIEYYQLLTPEAAKEFFGVLAAEYDPDPGEVLRLAERYAVARSPENLIELPVRPSRRARNSCAA